MDGKNLEKPLPSNLEAERTILGSVLIDNAVMQQAAESLDAEDFYSPMHRRVFAAMLKLFSGMKPIDPMLIGEELKKDGALDGIGGVSVITNLSLGLPIHLNIAEYILSVREKSYLRKLARVCGAIAVDAMSEERSADTVFADAQAQINDLCLEIESGNSDEFFAPLSKIIDNEVLQALEDLRKGHSPKLKTGFSNIDYAIGGGLAPSDVLLVAADTGAGKSAFALQLAYHFASTGTPAAFLAGEMTNKENALRLLSQISGVTNLNSATHISESDHKGLVEWAMAIRESPIRFEHRISDLHTLRTHLRALVRRHKIKVLVIDYIQLFKLEKVNRLKRNERIAEASQEVKRLANEMGIGIIEVAQFNREGAKSVQAGLHDLEGSGQLEKDASLIFILELGQTEYYDQGRHYLDAKIRIVKGRNVGKSEITGRYYGRSVQFEF